MNPQMIMSMYQQMKSNPAQMLSQRFNIPQDINTNDPNAILQHLLNSGQVSQAQVNSIWNNPTVRMMMKR